MVESAVKLLQEVRATLAGLPCGGSPKVQKLERIARSMDQDVEDLEAAVRAANWEKQVTAYRHLVRRAYRFYRILGADGVWQSERSGF